MRRQPQSVLNTIDPDRTASNTPFFLVQALLSRTRYLQDGDCSSDALHSPTGSDDSDSSPTETKFSIPPAFLLQPSYTMSDELCFGQSSPVMSSPPPRYHTYPPRVFVNIDVLSGNITLPCVQNDIDIVSDGGSQRHSSESLLTLASLTPCPLQCERPSVTFTSPTLLSTSTLYSAFHIFLDSVQVHTEITRFAIRPQPSTLQGGLRGDDQSIYETQLAPNYWALLANSPGKCSCNLSLR